MAVDLRLRQFKARGIHPYAPQIFTDNTLWVFVPPWEVKKAEENAVTMTYMHATEIRVFRATRQKIAHHLKVDAALAQKVT